MPFRSEKHLQQFYGSLIPARQAQTLDKGIEKINDKYDDKIRELEQRRKNELKNLEKRVLKEDYANILSFINFKLTNAPNRDKLKNGPQKGGGEKEDDQEEEDEEETKYEDESEKENDTEAMIDNDIKEILLGGNNNKVTKVINIQNIHKQNEEDAHIKKELVDDINNYLQNPIHMCIEQNNNILKFCGGGEQNINDEVSLSERPLNNTIGPEKVQRKIERFKHKKAIAKKKQEAIPKLPPLSEEDELSLLNKELLKSVSQQEGGKLDQEKINRLVELSLRKRSNNHPQNGGSATNNPYDMVMGLDMNIIQGNFSFIDPNDEKMIIDISKLGKR